MASHKSLHKPTSRAVVARRTTKRPAKRAAPTTEEMTGREMLTGGIILLVAIIDHELGILRQWLTERYKRRKRPTLPPPL